MLVNSPLRAKFISKSTCKGSIIMMIRAIFVLGLALPAQMTA